MTTHCCQIKRIQKISKASERLKSRFHKLLAIAGLACAVSSISENHCTHLVLWRQGRASWSPTDSSPLRLSMRFEQFASMAWSQGTRARRAERWRASAAKRLRAIRCSCFRGVGYAWSCHAYTTLITTYKMKRRETFAFKLCNTGEYRWLLNDTLCILFILPSRTSGYKSWRSWIDLRCRRSRRQYCNRQSSFWFLKFYWSENALWKDKSHSWKIPIGSSWLQIRSL